MADRPTVEPGSFTGLAQSYSQFRPSYSDSVLDALMGLAGGSFAARDLVDVGAGTGIWTRMLATRAPKTLIAVEPNADMRLIGARDSQALAISWRAGSGEDTGLPTGCCDFVTMASSFHWVDFDKGLAEFSRILRPDGHFAALWNPRRLEANPLLLSIEDHLKELQPALKRVSSGRSGITDTLTERLSESRFFHDVVYLEAQFVLRRTTAEYIGAWTSTNDVQSQLGARKFADFIDFARRALSAYETVDVPYLTRAWCARRRET